MMRPDDLRALAELLDAEGGFEEQQQTSAPSKVPHPVSSLTPASLAQAATRPKEAPTRFVGKSICAKLQKVTPL